MSETSLPDPSPEAKPGAPLRDRPRRRIRRLHVHVGLWTIVSGGLIALFLVLSSMSLTGRVVVLPDWVGDRIVERLNASLGEGRVTLRNVAFGVTPKGRPKLRLVDVGLVDGSGLGLGQINTVEGGFRLGAALAGRLEPTLIALRGAQVTVRRLADGSFALSLGQSGNAYGSLAAALDGIDALFIDGLLATAEDLSASELTITLEDARSGRIWQVTDGRLDVSHTETFVETTVSFDVFNQTEELAHTVLAFRTAKASSEASISARFENAAAVDIAAQTPALAFLSVIDAPISGALRTSIDTSGQLSELAGTMEIAEGALAPGAGTAPADFDGAKVYIDYDPARQRLDMLGLSVRSELGAVQGEGHFYLGDFSGGWPASLTGQVQLSSVRLNPEGIFAGPLDVDRAMADFRIRLDPFSLDIGQAVAYRDGRRFEAQGQVAAEPEGWRAAIDVEAERADRAEVLALWPVNQAGDGRDWFARNVARIEAVDSHISFRQAPGGKFSMDAVYNVRDASVQVLESLPPVEVRLGYVTQTGTALTVGVDEGSVLAPDGSRLDVSGLTFHAPDLARKEQIDAIRLPMSGPVEGVLSLLALPPFEVFKGSGFGPDVARGRADLNARIALATRNVKPGLEEVDFTVTGTLSDVRSDRLLADKLVIGDRLEVRATPKAVEISGPVRIGQASLSGTWRQPIRTADTEDGVITGTAELSARSLAEFSVGLPEGMLSGAGRAQFRLDLPGGAAPRLSLTSDLSGLGLRIDGTGWSKPPATAASLALEATLGARPVVETLTLKAPGLDLAGRITTAEGGGLGEARFDRVRLGGWLDGPVVLTGRGANQPIGIAITGGSIDLRRAKLGSGSGGGARGPREPLSLTLDRLIVTDGISFSNLTADLDMAGGLNGTFRAAMAGSGAQVQGTVAQTAEGAAFRLTSADAGGVLRGAGIFDSARGGALELVLAPVAAAGTYEGEFTITDTRVVNAPALAELISAVSIVGLIDQVQGEGIGFSTVEGRFRLAPGRVTLYRSSAVGLSLGLSMDGYYDMNAGQIDMQGVLSPLYIVNAIGRVFSPREGEGLIGFNFTMKGGYDAPAVAVNPLSILTPGIFREIFRRPPPEVPAE